jgi:hypothetical protein
MDFQIPTRDLAARYLIPADRWRLQLRHGPLLQSVPLKRSKIVALLTPNSVDLRLRPRAQLPSLHPTRRLLHLRRLRVPSNFSEHFTLFPSLPRLSPAAHFSPHLESARPASF